MKSRVKSTKIKGIRRRTKKNIFDFFLTIYRNSYEIFLDFLLWIAIFIGLKEPFSKSRKTQKINAKDSASDEQQRRDKITKAQKDKNLKKKTLF